MKPRMHCASLAALVFLAACATAPDRTPQTYRDPTAQIASQTNVTAQDLSGLWIIRQSVPTGSAPHSALSLQAGPTGALTLHFCADPACETRAAPLAFTPTGPGRWAPARPRTQDTHDDLWVMWMDYDGRTAAIGTPSGSFGWIMDRSATGGADRITAARDVMDWFGYDTANLNPIAP